MKKKILGVSKPAWLGALAIGLLTPIALWAVVNVDTDTIFELDGNVVTDGFGDDWLDVANETDGGTARVFLTDSITANDIGFAGGGSKDGRDISGSGTVWAHDVGAPPDKNNIEHAFAVAYQDASTDGDLHIYFGADRFDGTGTSAIGFWFFQDSVSVGPNGTFNGVHQVGDVLVTSDYVNGGGVSVINVFKWVGGKNPLQLLISGTPALPGSVTDPSCLVKNVPGEGNRNVVCATSNRTNVPVPAGWPDGYVDKDGNTNTFLTSVVFEGGINISELLGTNTTCFSSFLAMTRTSASTTAILKDFALGAFPLCKVDISKTCNGTTTVVNNKFHTEYTVTLTNSGGSTVFDPSFIEATGKLSTAGYTCKLTEIGGVAINPTITLEDGLEVPLAQTLGANASVTGTVECDTPENGFENTASGIAYTDLANTTSVTADAVSDDCPLFQFSNQLGIVKDCASPVTVAQGAGGTLTPEVCVDITVTNLRNEPVSGIQVTDNKIPNDTTEFPAFALSAAGGVNVSKTFSDVCYTPSAADNPAETDPGAIEYTDTASASGTGVLSNATVASTTDTATCPLCPCVDCD